MPKIQDYPTVRPTPGAKILGVDDAGKTSVFSMAELVGTVDAEGVSEDRAAVTLLKEQMEETANEVHSLAADLPALKAARDLLVENLSKIEAAIAAAEQLDIGAINTRLNGVDVAISAVATQVADLRSAAFFGGGL